ncbi:Ribosomal large subunit pseudouridine synthase D [Arsenophonus endosymbiont of Aleurodicus dispersus]|uniref:23S rRNA pseudouridine(1911/1915/1917) synthase RluD n=1 Tax=Arsenophonus endosymbiont of Aleurodicus dispersus TaxID=235559 RepID=UPI000EB54538|nr:23S rRNA pseudouridine(1911/1915/1917) synthase RluD [Arsenophonus endosymbiont of Aleurodicus dispersus]VAY02369.1 Ribosomal large subunit pseudouridine synthase D [Arsenophonus endosymbiont of Aleurodicus dispersus]
MAQKLQLKGQIQELQLGQRLDLALAKLFSAYSRSQIKKWILDKKVQVNGNIINRPKEKVFGNEQIYINVLLKQDVCWQPQNIPLNIIYEDEEIVIINKPHNLVVHPGAGNPEGTVLNALLYRYPKIINVPRAGIVHRLDKNTTGLMVIAKTIPVHTNLVKALQLRNITREYEAVVSGLMTTSGIVNEPISRHPTKRTHMAIHPLGKSAITYYRVIDHFRAHTRLRLRLESGRTHQIRVHMAHINHPLVGDIVYGGRPQLLKYISDEFCQIMNNFNRQALHARMLRLYHPSTGIKMEWHADIPADMAILINLLKIDAVTNMVYISK